MSLVNRSQGKNAPGGALSKGSKRKKGPAGPAPPMPLQGEHGKYKTQEDFVSNRDFCYYQFLFFFYTVNL